MGTYTYDPAKPCPVCGGIEYEISDARDDPFRYRQGMCNAGCGPAYWDRPVTPMSLRRDEGRALLKRYRAEQAARHERLAKLIRLDEFLPDSPRVAAGMIS